MSGIGLRRALCWAAPLAVFGVAVVRVCAVPSLAPLGAGDPAARERVARAVRDAEPGYRRDALERFPGDPWSQGDHVAVQERTLVERLAGEEKMRIGAVLDAIDRDVKRGHDSPSGRERGRVAPCMPRTFYD